VKIKAPSDGSYLVAVAFGSNELEERNSHTEMMDFFTDHRMTMS
jgi:hypothetical protein